MKDNRKFNVNVYMKAYLFSEVTDKLRTTIRYNEVEGTVFLIEFCKPDVIYTNSINFLHKYECGIFEKVIHDNYHIDVDFFVNVDE